MGEWMYERYKRKEKIGQRIKIQKKSFLGKFQWAIPLVLIISLTSSFEHNDVTLSSIKGREILDQLSGY
jgi:hypothetical protein